MARVAGVDLRREKRVEISLTYVFGIGRTLSDRILQQAGINPDTRVRDLTEAEVSRINTVITANHKVEGVKRLMDIGCYRGLRHRRGLPVHGQRTRTNSRTRKGPVKTVGARRKK